jgi:hypothetical protein
MQRTRRSDHAGPVWSSSPGAPDRTRRGSPTRRPGDRHKAP